MPHLYDAAAIDALPDVFYIFDRDRRLLQWNHHLRRLTGYTDGEIESMLATDFIEPSEAPLVEERIRHAFVHGAASVVVTLVAKGGRRTPYLFTGYRNDRSGDPVIVGMGIDMTEEVERRRQLKHLVLERTRELTSANRELERRANQDPLTGLPNRARLYALIDNALLEARRDGTCFYLLFVDLDDFKAVNDRFGHLAGDEILRAFAERLSGCVRAGDTVGRVAGDEFLVVLRLPVDESAARSVDQRIRDLGSQTFAYAGHPLRLAASVGMLRSDGRHADAAAVIHEADMLMYAGKRAARG